MTTIRSPRPDEWERWKALRLRALRDSPLAYLETLEQAETHDDELWLAPRVCCSTRSWHAPARSAPISCASG